jgi:hypothetical protein
MKKLLTTLALAALGVQAAFSQGQVNFANTSTTFTDGIDRFVYLGSVGGTKLTGTNYAAAIYWSAAGTPVNQYAIRTFNPLNDAIGASVGLFRAVDPATSTLAGTWVGGARFFNGANIGDTINLQIRVWDIQKFQSYDAAAAAQGGGSAFGQSDVFSFTIPAATDTAGLRMINMRAFAVTVPEPSTIALGVLGLGSLLLFRRKKA